jgi:hypothetical protein
MQQIADWLKELGMSEYAQRFAENGIDLAVLRDLTDQDLKDIGVLLGHRRAMALPSSPIAAHSPGGPPDARVADPQRTRTTLAVGGRLHFGTVAGIVSDSRPPSIGILEAF